MAISGIIKGEAVTTLRLIVALVKVEQAMTSIPRPGYVYLIRMGDTTYHKVGISQTDVRQRLAQLQTASPIDLILLAYYEQPDPLEVERAIHRALREYHARGEWFNLPTSIALALFNDFNMMASVDELMSAVDNIPMIDSTGNDLIAELVRRGLSANKIFEVVGGTRADVLDTVRRLRDA